MIETLSNRYSAESTQRELSNEYQHDRFLNGFQKYLCPLDKSSLSIGRVTSFQILGTSYCISANISKGKIVIAAL